MVTKSQLGLQFRELCDALIEEFGGKVVSDRLADALIASETLLEEAGFARPRFLGGVIKEEVSQ